MSWNDCTYITQSNFEEATQISYQSAYAQCVSEVDMSGSIYVTEESEHKLYINSGSQSGSLIYTSPSHGLDSEEVGGFTTGSFCPKCSSYFIHHGRENMIHMNTLTGDTMYRWQYEISQSNNDINEHMWTTDDFDVVLEPRFQSSGSSRYVTSGSNLDMVHELWTD